MAYKEWDYSVTKTLEKIKIKLDKNPETKGMYNGFYIWDSKLILNPDLMFIGINPRDGNPNNDKSINTKPSGQMSYLEFLDGENPSYTLARETVALFGKLGFNNDEIRKLLNERSVKTNLHYVITKSQNQMINCFNTLENNGYEKYKNLSLKWTNELIGILNPKLIICEGKGVFTKLTQAHGNVIWNSDCGHSITDKNVFIGYGRRLSYIRDKEGAAKLISRFLLSSEESEN